VGANADAHNKCKDYYKTKLEGNYSNLSQTQFCGENESENMYMKSNYGYSSPFMANAYRTQRIDEENKDNEQNKQPPNQQIFNEDNKYGIDKQGGSKRKKSKRRHRRTRRRYYLK